MEEFDSFIRIYHSNLIKGMFFSVLTVMFLQKFFPDVITRITFSILRWIIIVYSLLGITSYLLDYKDTVLSERATGPYWWSYWLMTICALGLPLLLLHKKLKQKRWLLLAISILVNIGWLFELFVITVTSLHRDYLPESWNGRSVIWDSFLIMGVMAIQGIFIGLAIVLIENIIRRLSKKYKFANYLKT